MYYMSGKGNPSQRIEIKCGRETVKLIQKYEYTGPFWPFAWMTRPRCTITRNLGQVYSLVQAPNRRDNLFSPAIDNAIIIVKTDGKRSTILIWNVPHRDLPPKFSAIAVSRTAVGDVIPCHWCGIAQGMPVLFLFIGYSDDLSFDAPYPRSRVGAASVVEISVPWFTVGLIPIYHPISVNVGRTLDVRASIWSSDSDTLNLDRHVHARIHGGPIFGNVLQYPPILAFSIGTTIPRWPDWVPECTIGNTILPSFLPSLPLFSQLFLLLHYSLIFNLK